MYIILYQSNTTRNDNNTHTHGVSLFGGRFDEKLFISQNVIQLYTANKY